MIFGLTASGILVYMIYICPDMWTWRLDVQKWAPLACPLPTPAHMSHQHRVPLGSYWVHSTGSSLHCIRILPVEIICASLNFVCLWDIPERHNGRRTQWNDDPLRRKV